MRDYFLGQVGRNTDRSALYHWEGAISDTSFLSDHIVAVYRTHEEAAAAIRALKASGHDVRHMSMIGQDDVTEERPIGFVNTGDRMWTWSKYGMVWGSIWGLLVGSGMLFVPGLGYIWFAGWLVSALEYAVVGGGLAALGGAFASIGIPTDTVVKYQTHLKDGGLLVLVHGNEDEVLRAEATLAGTDPLSLDSFKTPARNEAYSSPHLHT